MRITTVKKRGTEYLLASHGNSSVKIYSSERKVGSATYAEHCVTFNEAGGRVRRRFSDLDEAKQEAERVLIAMANGATKALTLTNADAEEYALAVAELRAVNVGLLAAAREYRAAIELLKGRALLPEAVRYFVASG